MTPNDIEVLIHCHVSQTQHPRYNFPAVRNAIEQMVSNGLIERVEELPEQIVFSTTKRGQAHITQLTRLPLPRAVWFDGSGNEIDL